MSSGKCCVTCVPLHFLVSLFTKDVYTKACSQRAKRQKAISKKKKFAFALMFAFVNCEQTWISLCVLHFSNMYIKHSKALATLTACDCDCVTTY